MEIPKPLKEHEWLQQLVGTWTWEAECDGGPGQPPVRNTGTEVVRSLGGLWTVGEGASKSPEGEECNMITTLGFDPATQRFVGTFIASVMTHLWPYNGTLDDSGTVLVLDSEGPGFSGDGKLCRYQDTIKIVDADHRILSSQVMEESGTWKHFMTSHYRRLK
ncbi:MULTISPECIES: DUF1579 domain-containing protein [unclassified Schlesneria]|uniref:DUF1579 domain-containing protein n=1 Tax=Schlesneria TaxID=656899 RepID=UPI002EFCEE6D